MGWPQSRPLGGFCGDILIAAFGGPVIGFHVGVEGDAGEGLLHPGGHVLRDGAQAGVDGFHAAEFSDVHQLRQGVGEGVGAADTHGVEVLELVGIGALLLQSLDGIELLVDAADEGFAAIGEEAGEFGEIPGVETEGGIDERDAMHAEAATMALEIAEGAEVELEDHIDGAVGLETVGKVGALRAGG